MSPQREHLRGGPSGPGALPALEAVPGLATALASTGVAVLVAPPGTGKTTGIPPALASRKPRPEGRTTVVVPRRIAARAAAGRMASLAGEDVGQRYGYTVRDDSRTGPLTEVELVTPGLLLRRLQADPGLEGVATVVLDEFHERSVDQDLLLALLLDSRSALRDDLELLVMSATLDVGPVSALLGEAAGAGSAAPVIEVESPLHPVETHWRPGSVHAPIASRVSEVVVEALGSCDGDVLAFLPGRGEIAATVRELAPRLGKSVELLELHGSTPPRQQDAVLSPGPGTPRRVVLATAIAETSITVPRVSVVVDSGLRRYQAFHAGSGLPSLRTSAVSLATADQRRGRAGRTAAGDCFRLWSRRDEELMRSHDPPEIAGAELSSLLLATTTWGAGDPAELSWLDPPPPEAVEHATALLFELGALDDRGRPTSRGREMARFGFHPRMAAVALAATGRGSGDPAATDPTGADPDAVELAARTLAVLDDPPGGTTDLAEAVLARSGARSGAQRGRSTSRWRRRMRHLVGPSSDREPPSGRAGTGEEDLLGRIVLAGFADRLARRRPRRSGTYLLRHGGEVSLPRHARTGALADSEWLVVIDLDSRRDDPRGGIIHMALGLDSATVGELLADAGSTGQVDTEVEHGWSPTDGTVSTVTVRRLGALTVSEERRRSAPPEAVAASVESTLASGGLEALPGWRDLDGLRSRLAFLRARRIPRPTGRGSTPATGMAGSRDWPDLSRAAVASSLSHWVPPLVAGAAHFGRDGEVTRFGPTPAQLEAALLADLGFEDRKALGREAPRHWRSPGGKELPLVYGAVDGDPASVLLRVRLQLLLGIDEHPALRHTPITVELLSPAGRPLQRTEDLPGFWRGTYAQVRAEMRGRYPKHAWPEQPWLKGHGGTR
ncbi:MAG: ATP-dependent helicase HrpB [Microthrixaceae bacterium]|nr:ATP-dependent helicase HrpB [Microthrixaceae bacterium]